MATARIATYEELTKLATNFVTTQKGFWDHAAWMDFVSSVQDKGFDISEEMQSNLGDLLGAMNRFYTACAATESIEKTMKAVVHDSVEFVNAHKGVWDHSDWEEFVKTAQQNTLSLSGGTTEYLGGVLESIKVLYALSPAVAAKKRTPAIRAKSSPESRPTSPVKKKVGGKSVEAKTPVRKKVAKKPPKK